MDYTIHLATTKVVLAAELGMRRETLSRLLTNLRKSGELAVHGREIVVLNPGRLRELLNETGDWPGRKIFFAESRLDGIEIKE